MVLKQFDKKVCLYRLQRGDLWKKHFVISINMLPLKPIPRRIVFHWGGKMRSQQWSMSWNKFLDQKCIGTVAVLQKDDFRYSKNYRRN